MRASAVLVSERRPLVYGYGEVGKDCAFALRCLVLVCCRMWPNQRGKRTVALVCGYVLSGQGFRFRSPWYGAFVFIAVFDPISALLACNKR